MKILTLLVCSFLFFGCNDTVPQQVFDFENTKGIWVPFEIINNEGTVFTKELTIADIFAPYMGCFKLNDDLTFSAFIWTRDGDSSDLEPSGTYLYSDRTNTLTFSGVWTIKFELIKFEGNEMWLKNSGALYKFQRENG